MADVQRSLDDTTVPVRSTGTVQAEVDGDLILLSPKDFSYFGAQGAGETVWELVDGRRSIGDIVASLETEFSADEGVIRAETLEFIDALVEVGLITIS